MRTDQRLPSAALAALLIEDLLEPFKRDILPLLRDDLSAVILHIDAHPSPGPIVDVHAGTVEERQRFGGGLNMREGRAETKRVLDMLEEVCVRKEWGRGVRWEVVLQG